MKLDELHLWIEGQFNAVLQRLCGAEDAYKEMLERDRRALEALAKLVDEEIQNIAYGD